MYIHKYYKFHSMAKYEMNDRIAKTMYTISYKHVAKVYNLLTFLSTISQFLYVVL